MKKYINIEFRVLLVLLITSFFFSCKGGYKVEFNKVFYTTIDEGLGKVDHVLHSAEPETFEILGNGNFGKDRFQVYYRTQIVTEADPTTFETINHTYSKDLKSVFRNAKKIDGADPKSFQFIDEFNYTKDKNDVYYQWTALRVQNINSFTILDYEYGDWAKDLTHFYIKSEKFQLSDYPTFEVIGNGYAKDNVNVYYQGQIVQGADPAFFETTEYAYGKDDSFLYEANNRIPVEDIGSHEIINGAFSKDRLNVYHNNILVKGAEASSFKVLNWAWQRDTNNIYYKGRLLDYIDRNSFELLNANYSKDLNNIFYYERIIEGADIGTFKVDIMTHIGQDKNYCYKDGRKIDCDK